MCGAEVLIVVEAPDRCCFICRGIDVLVLRGGVTLTALYLKHSNFHPLFMVRVIALCNSIKIVVYTYVSS